ncbi:MAG: hypothetical protein WCA56_02455 [Xanthobacteraceae bacterium]
MSVKAERPKGVLIARLEATDVTSSGAPLFFVAVGALAMIAAVVFESSAIRLAAWGAIWTGWNVLCSAGILGRRQTNYFVYREPPSN